MEKLISLFGDKPGILTNMLAYTWITKYSSKLFFDPYWVLLGELLKSRNPSKNSSLATGLISL